MRVAVLGAGGMLGHMVADVLDDCLEISSLGLLREDFKVGDKLDFIKDYNYVVNCIGMVKPRIYEDDLVSVINAYRVNSWFPKQLLSAAEIYNTKIIQIATDCVFDGAAEVSYLDHDSHDATDIYGQSKSLGEHADPMVKLLRCSIIGPELESSYSLMSWFRNSPLEEVNGYTNHFWNGLSTLAFAKICCGIVTKNLWDDLPGVMNLIPNNAVSKCDLLLSIQKHYKIDRDVVPCEDTKSVNRVLATFYHLANIKLWDAAGYEGAPTIDEMVEELAEWEK